jgi:hypothetical protein
LRDEHSHRDGARFHTFRAAIVASNTTAALTFDDLKTAQEILSGLKTRPSIEAAVVYSSSVRSGAFQAQFSAGPRSLDAADSPAVIYSSDTYGSQIDRPGVEEGER